MSDAIDELSRACFSASDLKRIYRLFINRDVIFVADETLGFEVLKNYFYIKDVLSRHPGERILSRADPFIPSFHTKGECLGVMRGLMSANIEVAIWRAPWIHHVGLLAEISRGSVDAVCKYYE